MSSDGRAAVLPTAKAGELLHLDLLRFIASVAIVLVHSAEFLAPRPYRPPVRAATGVWGLYVDVFFVISGFVIAHIYAGRTRTVGEYLTFIQRRVARLIPLHLLVVLCWVLVYAAINRIGLNVNHAVSLSPACIATSTLLMTAYVKCGGLPPAQANWSISAEMGMYLLFPVFVAVIGGRAWRAAFLAAMMLAANLWHGLDILPLNVTRALPAFPLGIAYFYGRKTLARLPLPQWGLGVSLLALFAAAVAPVDNVVALALAYAMPAFAIAADERGLGGALLRRVAPLGQLTYSIYMLHGLIVLVVLNAVADKWLQLPLAGMWIAAAITYALLFLAARVSLVRLEDPARAAINRLQLFGRAPRHVPLRQPDV